MDRGGDGVKDEFVLYRRNGGCGAVYQGIMYVWGGQSYEEEEDEDYDEKIRAYFDLPRDDEDAIIDMYDAKNRMWWQHPTRGDVPRVGLGSKLCVVEAKLYLYGGWNDYNFNSDLFRLDLSSFIWEKVSPKSNIKPTPVYLTSAVVYKNSICTFGGVGLPVSEEKLQDNKNNGLEYHPYSNHPHPWGRNNEYHEFDVETECWTSPAVQGRPPPMSAMDFVRYSQHHGVLFGGRATRKGFPVRMGEQEATNRMFFFNFETKVWFEPIMPPLQPGITWPQVRMFHTLTCLFDPDTIGGHCEQKVLLLWGKYEVEFISSEVWVLKLSSDYEFEWKRVRMDLTPRTWHIACPVYSPGSGATKILVFGGLVHVIPNEKDRTEVSDLRVIEYGVAPLREMGLQACYRYQLKRSLERLPPLLVKEVEDAGRKFNTHKPIRLEHCFNY